MSTKDRPSGMVRFIPFDGRFKNAEEEVLHLIDSGKRMSPYGHRERPLSATETRGMKNALRIFRKHIRDIN